MPVCRLRAFVRSACVACVSVPLTPLIARSLLPRHRPAVVFLPAGLPVACLCGGDVIPVGRPRPPPPGVFVLAPPVRGVAAVRILPRACPPSVIRHPSDVAGLPVPSGGGFSCRPVLACRRHSSRWPVCFDMPFAPPWRVVVRDERRRSLLSLAICLYFSYVIGGAWCPVRLVAGAGWRKKNRGRVFRFPVPLLVCCF